MKYNNKLIKRVELGRLIRNELMKKLPNNVYQLSQLFNKNPATILYHLKILEREEKVIKQKNIENGRFQTTYLPNLLVEKNEISLSKDFFHTTRNEVWIYALTSNTFGISVEEHPDWKEASLWHDCLNNVTKGEGYFIKLPEKVVKFYDIPFRTVKPIYSPDKKQALFTFYF